MGTRVERDGRDWLAGSGPAPLGGARPKVCIGTTDVHEHGKYLVERAIEGLGAETVDAGMAVDPGVLVSRGIEAGAHALAISTYNGVALGYAQAVRAELDQRGLDLPVPIGGRLNQIPDGFEFRPAGRCLEGNRRHWHHALQQPG